VVEEAVEHADRSGVFGEEPTPGFERPVRSDAEGAAFVGGGEAEQQLGAGVVERGEAEFVELCRYPHRSTYADTATMPRRRVGWAGGCAGHR
jgi:hypothetical protein